MISEKLKEFSPKATEADQTSFITQLTKAIEAKKVLEVGKVQHIISINELISICIKIIVIHTGPNFS